MPTIADLRAELDQEAPTTRRAIARLPDDRLDWRPHPRSLSAGQLAMHLATLPHAIAQLSLAPSFQVGAHLDRPSAPSTAHVLAVFDDNLVQARAALGEMTDESLAEPWRMRNGDRELLAITRGALLRTVLLNHWYHHRGQLAVYLRLLDIPVPGIYGESADEMPQLG